MLVEAAATKQDLKRPYPSPQDQAPHEGATEAEAVIEPLADRLSPTVAHPPEEAQAVKAENSGDDFTTAARGARHFERAPAEDVRWSTAAPVVSAKAWLSSKLVSVTLHEHQADTAKFCHFDYDELIGRALAPRCRVSRPRAGNLALVLPTI
jgi:hypothetical protein